MDKPNYRMIELARNSRGLTQKQLATLLPKINQPNISKIERGELPFTEEYVDIISKALDYPKEFFFQVESKIPVSSLYFRKRATIPQKVLNKITADICIILKGIDTLLQDIELKEYPKFCFNISEGWTPKSVALRMKEIMQLDTKRPIKNIITKIEELGVIVFFYDCNTDKFDGTTSYTDNGTPVIFVNKNVPNDRLKRTIVHEFFHLVMHIPCNVEPWRNPEQETDEATSEFFMPEDVCLVDFAGITYNGLGALKSYWGVAKSSIIRRAKDLRLIDANTYTYLNIELGRRGERKKENGVVDIDSPKILPTVMNLLKEQLSYTNEDLAKKVCLSLIDYCNYFEPQENSQIRLRVVNRAV
jgi:Zn-dependent peptidase ImmA (M78 family)/transcriptional regulator with XRE-family HTH domain